MKIISKIKKHKVPAIIMSAVLAIIIVLGISQVIMLRKAHSSFDNYAAFRGCQQITDRNPDYGHCRLSSGQIIKLVKFKNRWYLDGDLPRCDFGICF